MSRFFIVSLFFLQLCGIVQAAIQPMVALRHIRQQVQARQDVIVNGMIGGALFGGSDMLAQRIEINKRAKQQQQAGSDFDWYRASSAAVLGACLSCGVYPAGYKFIDKMWKRQDFISLVQKSVVEIFTVGIFANSISMLVRGLIPDRRAGKPSPSISQVLMHIKEELPEVTLHDFSLWFPYNMAAFGFVPSHIRPLTTALVDAVWQTYMSLRSNNVSTAPSVTESLSHVASTQPKKMIAS